MKCSQVTCNQPATHTLVWANRWVPSCAEHAQGLINVGAAIGYNEPRLTLRLLTPAEMMADESEATDDE